MLLAAAIIVTIGAILLLVLAGVMFSDRFDVGGVLPLLVGIILILANICLWHDLGDIEGQRKALSGKPTIQLTTQPSWEWKK